MANWTPALLNGTTLVLWLDAAQETVVADGTIVTTGKDNSPNATHFEGQPDTDVPASNYAPTYQTGELNGGPVYRFNNGDFTWDVYFQRDAVPQLNAQPMSVVSLVKPWASGGVEVEDVWTSISEGGTDMLALTRWSDGEWRILHSPPTTPVASIVLGNNPDSDWQIVTAVINGASSFGSLDGVITSGSLPSSGATFNGGVVVGYDYGFSGNRYDGDMRQVAFIKGALTIPQVKAWEGYLAHSCGLTSILPSNHPYKLVAPQDNQYDTLPPSESSVARQWHSLYAWSG